MEISKTKIILYLGTFFSGTIALIFLYTACTIGEYGLFQGLGYATSYKHLEDILLGIELCIVLLIVSTIPSFLIFNSLLNQMIVTKRDSIANTEQFESFVSSDEEEPEESEKGSTLVMQITNTNAL